MALAIGTRLGAYEITGQLGAGGMGEVYRALDTKLGREVAIKTLPSALAKDRDRLAHLCSVPKDYRSGSRIPGGYDGESGR